MVRPPPKLGICGKQKLYIFHWVGSRVKVSFLLRDTSSVILKLYAVENVPKNFNSTKVFFFQFLAYFQILNKYAIVRALSVRPSVPLLLFRGLIDLARLWRNRKLMTPGHETRKEFFFGPTVAPTGGVQSPISIHFHIKIRFYWYLRRVMSLILDRVRRSQKCTLTQNVPSTQKVPPTQKVPSDPKSATRPKKCHPTQKVPPTQKVSLDPKSDPEPKI